MELRKARRNHSGSGGVRIIGGTWRGRRIRVPERTAVRPTPDRVRETVFNWLSGVIAGARCLDLFAGSGVLGLEALSRGAADACLVEKDPILVAALESVSEEFDAGARVVAGDALGFLDRQPTTKFDIAFSDPPYNMDLGSVLEKLAPWLTPENHVYVERPGGRGEDPRSLLTAGLPNAELLKHGRAGNVIYGLLRLQI